MDRRALLAILVGGLLLTNPAWLVPAADDPRHVYRASPADPRDVRADAGILVCPGDSGPTGRGNGTGSGDDGRSRACATERRALTDGVAVGRDPEAFADRPAFVYFVAADRYVRPGVRWVDGARIATGVPVASESVRDGVARDGTEAFDPPAAAVVEEALATGVARSRTRVELAARRPDGPVVVDRGDSYVAVRRTGTERTGPLDSRGRVWAFRGGLAALGLALVGGGLRRRRGGR
jgi:hypothetical protein